MLRIAGQTAGTIGLKFFVDTFHGQSRALQLVINNSALKKDNYNSSVSLFVS